MHFIKTHQLAKAYFILFIILMYLGRPISKIVFLPNSELYVLIIIMIALISLTLFYKTIYYKNYKKHVLATIFFLTLVVLKLLTSEIIFSDLKKLFLIFIPLLSYCILFLKKEVTLLMKKFSNIKNSYITGLMLLLLLQTLVAKSGTYGMIYYSNDYLNGNLYDFKSQRILIATIFTIYFFRDRLSIESKIISLFNVSLLITFSRINMIIFLVLIIVLIVLRTEAKKSLMASLIVFLFLASGSVDLVGNLTNRIIKDDYGKLFAASLCAYSNLNDSIEVEREELKKHFVARDVDMGKYLTFPRYFSFSNINLPVINEVEIYKNGLYGICEDYTQIISNQEIINYRCNLESCLKKQSHNFELANSSIQSSQLTGNVTFRVEYWSNIFDEFTESNKIILLGLDLGKNLGDILEYETLWHAHNSFISTASFYGLIGLCYLIFVMTNTFSIKFIRIDSFFIVILMLSILSLTDAVLEIPDLGYIFWYMVGLIGLDTKN